MAVLKVFVLFLKPESDWKAEGSRDEKGIQQSIARDVKGRDFSKFKKSG